MFKRIEKRLKRREEERKLGIDDDTRDVLGLNDTDSEESESESDSDLSDDAFEGESEGDEAWGGIGGGETDAESDASEEEDASPRYIAFPVFTAQQALDDPIYPHPTQDNAHLCSICPGRTLINAQTISQHLASKAHERRSKHLAELGSLPENADSSLSDLMQLMEGRPRPGSHPEGEDTYTSKRAEKKRKTTEIRKAKREKRKARKMEKRKAEEEEDARDDTEKAVVAKDNKKRKAESSSKAMAQPTASKKKTELTVKDPPTAITDKKRKKSVEKDAIVATEGAPAKKKRKTGGTGVRGEQEIAEKITKSVATTADRRKAHVPAKKNRNTDETGVPSEREIEEKIQELTKSLGMREDRHAHAPAKKKGKTGETGAKELTRSVAPVDSSTKKKRQPRTNEGEQQVTQKIQDIAKSATKRAHLAQSKASNGQGKKKKVV